MHTVSDVILMLTVFTRTAMLVGNPDLDCPGLPDEFQPFLKQQPSPSDLQAIEPQLLPFAIVTLRNGIQQALGNALSCDTLDVVIRLDLIHPLNSQT